MTAHRIELRCVECGERFLVKPYQKDKAKFCSRACGGKLRMRETLNTPDMLLSRRAAMIGNKFAVGNGGNATSFKSGSVAWNKGVKGTHHSPETEWKKGQRGVRWLPVGSERERFDKNGAPRVFLKIAEPNKWRERAIVVWEHHHGIRLPRGFVVHHIDRNSTNDDLSNLQALTRAAHINIHRDDIVLSRRRVAA